MKAIGFGILTALGLALTLTTGCQPENLKNIPGRRPPQYVDTTPAPMIVPNPIPETKPIEMTPLGDTPGHPGWTENHDALKDYTVHFAFDSSVIAGGDKSKVAAVADYLKKNPLVAVRVEGNCDERGTPEYNRSLGERRALAGREELIRLGIESGRVDTLSYGEDRPAAEGSNEAAWKQNRRDEFVVLTRPGQ